MTLKGRKLESVPENFFFSLSCMYFCSAGKPGL